MYLYKDNMSVNIWKNRAPQQQQIIVTEDYHKQLFRCLDIFAVATQAILPIAAFIVFQSRLSITKDASTEPLNKLWTLREGDAMDEKMCTFVNKYHDSPQKNWIPPHLPSLLYI